MKLLFKIFRFPVVLIVAICFLPMGLRAVQENGYYSELLFEAYLKGDYPKTYDFVKNKVVVNICSLVFWLIFFKLIL